MRRCRSSFDELVELAGKHDNYIFVVNELACGLASLFASHGMVQDIAELLPRVPDQVDLGKLYGIAVATVLNLERTGMLENRYPAEYATKWREWVGEFKDRIRGCRRAERYHLCSAMMYELAIRAGDVRKVLWPDSLPTEQSPLDEELGSKTPESETVSGADNQRRRGSIGGASERFARYLAKLICYAHVGDETFKDLLKEIPERLERIGNDEDADIRFGEAVSMALCAVFQGVSGHDRRGAIAREIVKACFDFADQSFDEGVDGSSSLDRKEHGGSELVNAVAVLFRSGYRDLALKLFSLFPEGSELAFHGVAALANSAALGGNPRRPESLVVAKELYEEARKRVVILPPNALEKQSEKERKVLAVTNRREIGNLLMIGSRAAAHCCDEVALEAFESAHQAIKFVDPSSALLRFSLVQRISKSFVIGWKWREEFPKSGPLEGDS